MSPMVVSALLAAASGWLLVWPGARPPRPARRTTGWVGPAALVGVVGLVVPQGWLVPGLLLAGAGLATRGLWLQRLDAGRSEVRAARLAEVCDLLAAELAAGRTPGAALEEAAQVWPELRHVADADRLGGDVPAALREVARLPGADGLRLLAAAWQVSHRLGAGLADSMQRVADATRRDQATRRLVAGELASARATARLIAVLPVVALLMGSGVGGDPWSFLLRTPVGWTCLGVGLTLGFAGLWWIEALAREVDR
jgi:tight adherence protein B